MIPVVPDHFGMPKRRKRWHRTFERPSTGKLLGAHLADVLHMRDGEVAFGYAYSIITIEAVLKGVGPNPATWSRMISKTLADGHATAFFVDYESKDKTFTMTGVGDEMVFYGGDVTKQYWARNTPNATTDLYYVKNKDVPFDLLRAFQAVRGELEDAGRTQVRYAEFSPNLNCSDQNQNCVSSTHYVVFKMGLGSYLSSKGFWIPSISNHMSWYAAEFAAWRHKRVSNCNTHFAPSDPSEDELGADSDWTEISAFSGDLGHPGSAG